MMLRRLLPMLAAGTLLHGGLAWAGETIERCPDPASSEQSQASAKLTKREALPALYQAIARSDLKAVKRLLARGENPSACVLGASLVAHAVAQRDMPQVELLLRAGAHIDRPVNAGGETPLLHAAGEGEWLTALRLVDHGADVRASLLEGVTALHVAAAQPSENLSAQAREQLDFVRALLVRGLGANLPTRDGKTALLLAVSKGNSRLVAQLLNFGADANLADHEGSTPLFLATMLGRDDIAAQLEQAGAKSTVNPSPPPPSIAQMVEQHRGAELTAALAITPVADTTRLQRQGLLMAAMLSRNPDAVAALARWGVEVDSVFEAQESFDTWPATPLLFALTQDLGTPIVRALLQAGASPNHIVRPTGLDTPLCYALVQQNFEAAKALMDAGADGNLVDPRYGQTALMAAVLAGTPAMRPQAHAFISRLLAAGAKPNAQNSQGFTALHSAALAGDAEAVKLLLAAGADPTLLDQKKRTPLFYARQERSAQIVALLRPLTH